MFVSVKNKYENVNVASQKTDEMFGYRSETLFGAGGFIYSGSARVVFVWNKVDSKEICWAEHEDMNIHTPK